MGLTRILSWQIHTGCCCCPDYFAGVYEQWVWILAEFFQEMKLSWLVQHFSAPPCLHFAAQKLSPSSFLSSDTPSRILTDNNRSEFASVIPAGAQGWVQVYLQVTWPVVWLLEDLTAKPPSSALSIISVSKNKLSGRIQRTRGGSCV